MIKTDCIAAIATAREPAGVGIVRLSGKNCFEITEKVFQPMGGKSFLKQVPRMMVYGKIQGLGFTDLGMCVKFIAPHSFTGEDMAEVHCHGGREIVEGVLKNCLKEGARLAENGEFTRRAFLNGKLDLTSCEGVADMINAQSAAEAAAASKLLSGGLLEILQYCQQVLTDVLSFIEVSLDYPEEDIPQKSVADMKKKLISVRKKLLKLSESYQTGKKLKDGVSVVLCGGTNAGKSSLFNRLLGEERAIVTEIAGTTRDVVEGEIQLDGVRIVLSDTAGLRESLDRIENIGMERSLSAVKNADIVLLLREGNSDGEETAKILELAKDKPLIFVRSKADRGKVTGSSEIAVSSVSGEGIDKLKQKITELIGYNKLQSSLILTNERHYRAVLRACDSLNEAIAGMEGKTMDLLSLDVRACWDILGEITGVTATEHIIDNIFSKFCLGK